MDFTKQDYEEALNQIHHEWRNFEVPQIIHDRIKELAWQSISKEETVKTIMTEFNTKECYAFKCYWFSEAFKYEREKYARIGMYLECKTCKESCNPLEIK